MGLCNTENVYSLPGSLLRMQIQIQQVWGGLRFCMSNKLPGDADGTSAHLE